MVNMGGVTNEIEGGGHDALFFCSFLVSLLASSLLAIFVWALTLQKVMLWWDFFIKFIICATWSFLGWLYWEEGF